MSEFVRVRPSEKKKVSQEMKEFGILNLGFSNTQRYEAESKVRIVSDGDLIALELHRRDQCGRFFDLRVR